MSDFNDGGPAFPVRGIVYDGALGGQLAHGMTLRDYAAIKVLPELFSDMSTDIRGDNMRLPEGWREHLAEEAYKLADAMLAERVRNEETTHD